MTRVWLLSDVRFPGPSDATAPENCVISARTLGACPAAEAAEKVRPAGPTLGGAGRGGRSRTALRPEAAVGARIKRYLQTGP